MQIDGESVSGRRVGEGEEGWYSGSRVRQWVML